MHTKQQVRELLRPADPARDAVVPPSSLAAHDLILRAEDATATPAGPARRAAPRRTVLVGAAAAVAVLGSAGVAQVLRDGPVPAPAPAQPVAGTVLKPVAYEVVAGEPAGPHLRALAARLVDGPQDESGGRYAYHHTKSWGGLSAFSPEGHMRSYVYERRNWAARDGRRWGDMDILGVEFPDAASREYFSTRRPTPATVPSPSGAPSGVREEPRRKLGKLPTDRAALARMLRTDQSAGDVAMAAHEIFVTHLVPRRTRADILTILADKPGFVWRGRVVDRAGREGVAITADLTTPPELRVITQRVQMLLVFDPSTGELLAYEYLELAPRNRVLHYLLLLHTGRTDTLG
ncbi:CU044_5270 family protein [Micromonospora sp. NPDC047620]|uniref:CU044_5270 family protein n=1 Tax=Micromonospora sp. NPDC047620 TaxID=3364251 RepID=UPI00371BEC34